MLLCLLRTPSLFLPLVRYSTFITPSELFSMRTTRTTRASDRALPHLPADPSPRSPSRSRSSSLSSPEPDPSSYRTPAKKRARTTPIKKEPLSSKKPKKGTPTSPVKKPRAASPKFAAYLETPYPDYARPTTEDCQEVTTRLAGLHGLPVRPGEVKKEITGSIGEACQCASSKGFARLRSICREVEIQGGLKAFRSRHAGCQAGLCRVFWMLCTAFSSSLMSPSPH
jgi:hypothetical protein